MAKIAVIRVRGQVHLNQGMKDTFSMLRLYRKNYCVVVENNPQTMGMVKKVKDYVIWGELNDEDAARLPKTKFIRLKHLPSMKPRRRATSFGMKKDIGRYLLK